jgi:hypothetical protein
MKSSSIKLGYWSSFICIVTFIIWTVCFIAIFLLNPLFKWTNMADFITYSNTYNQSFKYLAQFTMLLFAPAFLILMHSVNEIVAEDKKILGRIGISFATLFTACAGIHYFVQISSVRLSLANGQVTGLEQFIQSNPTSGIAGINLVGWTVFFSLSCFFMAPLFPGKGLDKVIRYSLIANGIVCILGGIGYISDSIILTFLALSLGMGCAILISTIALFIFFKRFKKQVS